jgi:hypothetical protein
VDSLNRGIRHCLDSTRRHPATQLRKMVPLNGGVRE